MVRLPFTRSGMATRLSTRPPKVARFSEPEDVLPTSAIRRCTGTDRELLRFLVLQGKVTNLSLPSPSSAPSRGRHGLTSRAERASEEACLAWTGPAQVKVRAVVSAGEAPPRTSSAHLIRRASTATKGGSSRAFCPHRVFTPRERGVSHHEASGSRTAPRREMHSTKTEVRSTVVRLDEPEDCSPFSSERASLPRSTCAPKNTDALQIERACAFVTTS